MNADDRSSTHNAAHIPDETVQDAKDNRERLAAAELNTSQATFTAESGQNEPRGTGVGYHSPNSRANLVLEERAVKRRYPSTARQRKDLMHRMMDLAANAPPHIAARAASVAIAAERADNSRIASSGARSSSAPQVNVTVQVAAREAAVFGDLAAFKAAAEHQAKQAVIQPLSVVEESTDKTQSSSE